MQTHQANMLTNIGRKATSMMHGTDSGAGYLWHAGSGNQAMVNVQVEFNCQVHVDTRQRGSNSSTANFCNAMLVVPHATSRDCGGYLEEVLVEGVNASANSRVRAQPVRIVSVQRVAEQACPRVSHVCRPRMHVSSHTTEQYAVTCADDMLYF